MSQTEIESARHLAIAERRKSVSDREWRHRLRGYGFGVTECEGGLTLTSLARNLPLCRIESAALSL